MARFSRIGSQICTNRLIRTNRLRVPSRTLSFCKSRFGALKFANQRLEAIRANCSNVMKIWVFLRIDSRESPRFVLRIVGPSKPPDTLWRVPPLPSIALQDPSLKRQRFPRSPPHPPSSPPRTPPPPCFFFCCNAPGEGRPGGGPSSEKSEVLPVLLRIS